MTADQIRAVAYFGFALFCVLIGRREVEIAKPVPITLAGIALLIILGESLGIGAAVTNGLRDASVDGGWYGARRFVQGVVIVVMGVFAAGAAVVVWRTTQSMAAAYALPAAAMCFHLCYLLARTSSFHYADAWLEVDLPLPGVHLHQGDVLELISCAVIGVLVWRAYTRGGYRESVPAP